VKRRKTGKEDNQKKIIKKKERKVKGEKGSRESKKIKQEKESPDEQLFK
jgi:hypothetical protein